MSTLVPTSCAGNSNPVGHLSDHVLRDGLLGAEQHGRQHTAASSSFRTRDKWDAEFLDRDWEDFAHNWDATEQIFRANALFGEEVAVAEEDDDFRQEWSDEYLTELYVREHGLDRLPNLPSSTSSHAWSNAKRYGESFVDEYLQREATSSQQTFSVKEYASFNLGQIELHTHQVDLYQAQLYLLDNLLSTLFCHALAATCRPSPGSEWDWARLFSPSRWDKTTDDERLEAEYLKSVAAGRLQMLLGHLAVSSESKERRADDDKAWDWEWDFYRS